MNKYKKIIVNFYIQGLSYLYARSVVRVIEVSAVFVVVSVVINVVLSLIVVVFVVVIVAVYINACSYGGSGRGRAGICNSRNLQGDNCVESLVVQPFCGFKIIG